MKKLGDFSQNALDKNHPIRHPTVRQKGSTHVQKLQKNMKIYFINNLCKKEKYKKKKRNIKTNQTLI
jgi:hypothetical protein